MNSCDVFLSHNSASKPAAGTLAHCLIEADHTHWMGIWNPAPNERWQEVVEL